MTVLTASMKKRPWGRVPNLITLSRVVLACIVNYYIRSRFGEIGVPLFILGLIFFTDYLDGKLARLYGTVSPGGAVLDLLADFFFVFLSYLVLHSLGLVPLWFIGVVFGKFLGFVFTSIYLKRVSKGSPVFTFDCLGRFVAAAFYLLPALLYGSHLLLPTLYAFCINKLTYILCFFSLISSAYRIGRCVRSQLAP
ncbi:MAG TPA: CDP-alcohol phosphatidyltransferase family protein [Firmicutes bacterium]|jgi:phosphatidylglycerophosphate synthase|nr:CDP-alcohol phosphatidyltransferase family protein [Bacillota bacterium]